MHGTLYQTASETRLSAAAISATIQDGLVQPSLSTLSAVEILYDSVLYKCTDDIVIALVLNPINAREFLITSKRQVATIKSSSVLSVLYNTKLN